MHILLNNTSKNGICKSLHMYANVFKALVGRGKQNATKILNGKYHGIH